MAIATAVQSRPSIERITLDLTEEEALNVLGDLGRGMNSYKVYTALKDALEAAGHDAEALYALSD